MDGERVVKLSTRKTGSVHGRFQPFHNDHLRYTLAASEKVDYLLVGLTQPDIGNLHWTPGAMHRDNLVDNPLTFFERLVIIEEVSLRPVLREIASRSFRFRLKHLISCPTLSISESPPIRPSAKSGTGRRFRCLKMLDIASACCGSPMRS